MGTHPWNVGFTWQRPTVVPWRPTDTEVDRFPVVHEGRPVALGEAAS